MPFSEVSPSFSSHSCSSFVRPFSAGSMLSVTPQLLTIRYFSFVRFFRKSSESACAPTSSRCSSPVAPVSCFRFRLIRFPFRPSPSRSSLRLLNSESGVRSSSSPAIHSTLSDSFRFAGSVSSDVIPLL